MKFYVSACEGGIALCSLENGKLEHLCDNTAVNGALWLTDSYACVHDPEGGYVVDLHDLGRIGTRGIEPCHMELSPDRRFMYCSNYQTGSIAVISLESRQVVQLVTHAGNGTPHAHFAAFNPRDGLLYACDLGLDTVFVYRHDPDSGHLTEAGRLILPPGSGPRHLVFDGDIIYCACELKSTVNVFRCGRLIQTVSSLPSGFTGESFIAAIRIGKDGLYVSNRGHNSIARFDTAADGLLTLRETIPCGGDWPRDLVITDEGILVANQRSGDVTLISGTYSKLDIPGAVCILPA